MNISESQGDNRVTQSSTFDSEAMPWPISIFVPSLPPRSDTYRRNPNPQVLQSNQPRKYFSEIEFTPNTHLPPTVHNFKPHDHIDLSYPPENRFAAPHQEPPYFPKVFGTFTIEQNYGLRNLVNINSNFAFKDRGFVPEFNHSAVSYTDALNLLGKDIEYWSNKKI